MGTYLENTLFIGLTQNPKERIVKRAEITQIDETLALEGNTQARHNDIRETLMAYVENAETEANTDTLKGHR